MAQARARTEVMKRMRIASGVRALLLTKMLTNQASMPIIGI